MVSAQVSEAQRINPVDIEDLLIWTYRDQRADRVIGCDVGSHDQEAMLGGPARRAGRDSLVALERLGLQGVRVDGGGPSCDALHIDAERTHEAVMRLDRPIALLVMHHARLGTRPDRVEIVPSKPVAATDARGRVRRGYDAWDVHRDYGWCEVEWTVPLGNAAVARLEYGLWRRALRRLAATLRQTRLTVHTVLPPSAPAISARLAT